MSNKDVMTVVISERGICGYAEGDNGSRVRRRSDVCNMKLHGQRPHCALITLTFVHL